MLDLQGNLRIFSRKTHICNVHTQRLFMFARTLVTDLVGGKTCANIVGRTQVK